MSFKTSSFNRTLQVSKKKVPKIAPSASSKKKFPLGGAPQTSPRACSRLIHGFLPPFFLHKHATYPFPFFSFWLNLRYRYEQSISSATSKQVLMPYPGIAFHFFTHRYPKRLFSLLQFYRCWWICWPISAHTRHPHAGPRFLKLVCCRSSQGH